jgi:hypothetical protein
MIKMKEEDSKRIQDIISGMQCPKNFKCTESGFEDLCKAKDFGDEESLQCLEETSPPCPFVGVYNYGFQMRFCRCPLRVYLAKNLGK